MHKSISKSVYMTGFLSLDDAWSTAMSIKEKYAEDGLFISYFRVYNDEYAEPPSWEIEVRAKRVEDVVVEGAE